MSRAETSARNYDPALMENIPIWLKHLDPTGALDQQVIIFDGNLGEWVNGYGGGIIGSTSGITSNPPAGLTTETWVGNGAGSNANNVYTVFLGVDAGKNATGATESIFIGHNAGYAADLATSSTFIGNEAGYQAFNSNFGVYIGEKSGYQASDSYESTFIGSSAGNLATNASYSVFIGRVSGQNASDADHSVFIGNTAGNGATTASYSIFIGNGAGVNDTVNNGATDWSILIGVASSTGGFSNSIAFGKNATNTAQDQTFFADSLTKFHHNLVAYDDDADAGLGGLVTGDWYQTTGSGAAPLNVAGIVMIKQ